MSANGPAYTNDQAVVKEIDPHDLSQLVERTEDGFTVWLRGIDRNPFAKVGDIGRLIWIRANSRNWGGYRFVRDTSQRN